MSENGMQISCTVCGAPYPHIGAPYKCSCGGVFDFSRFPAFIDPDKRDRSPGLWLYQESLGLPEHAPVVSLGEGNTPLLSSRFNDRPVYLKMEGQNPTGSYKDRGSAVLTSFLRSRNVSSAVEDSSGNAGASLAAYCASAGLSVSVFIPETASGPKRWQIEMYGADVHRIPGVRANAANAVLEAVKGGKTYASHAFMPFGLTGIATIAYEIFNQLGRAPGTLIAPVGHGGLLYGMMLGFEALFAIGASKTLPYYIGVQAENCAPVLEAYRRRSMDLADLVVKPTLAEGTSVSRPVRGGQILARMLPGGGEMQGGNEDQLLDTYVSAARSGVFCEPTSCLSLIPLLNDKIEFAEPVVAVFTGAGYKTNAIL